MTIASWLLTLVGPMALRVLTILGLGTVTFTGVTASLQTLIDMAMTNWSTIPVAVLQLASLMGIPQGLGIIAGAMTARVGMWAAVSATKFVLGGS